MKKIILLIVGLFILFSSGYGRADDQRFPNDSSGSLMQNTISDQLVPRQTPMSGIYTIGGADGDFSTFNAALSALKAAGHSEEPITFKVRPGTYTEQLDLEQVLGVINFEGETGDSTDVLLQYHGNAPVVRLMGPGSLRHMTISGTGARVITIKEGASFITIENTIIKGGTSATLIYYQYVYGLQYSSNHIYRNNLLIGGAEGIVKGRAKYFDYESGALELDNGPIIAGNIFQGQKHYGIRLFAQQNAVLEGNTIAIEDTGIAIELSNCFFENRINRNEIIIANARGTGISIRGEGYATEVIGNKITLLEGGTGMHFEDGDYRYTKALVVANNLISIFSKNKSTGIALEGPYYKGNFYFNTIHLYGNDPESRSIYFNLNSTADLLNNIFSNQAGGKAIDIGNYNWNSASGTTGYNVYFSEHAPSISGTNNLLFDPVFVSNRNLRPTNPLLDGAGIAVAGIETDTRGQLRNNPPDIGALEFEPGVVVPAVPLAGIYTLGGTHGDYTGFQAAISALQTRGISGPVTFKVRAGTYEEQLVITHIPGSACHVPVVFERAGSDSSEVLIKAEGDFVVKVEGVDGIAFREITLSSNTQRAKLLELEEANCFSLASSRLIGQRGSNQQLIWSVAAGENNKIINNFFANSSGYSIYMHSGEGEKGSLEFTGNRAEDIAGMSLYGLADLVFQDNQLTLSNRYINFVEGIEMNSAHYSRPIEGNRIMMENQGANLGVDISGLNNDFLNNEIILKGKPNGVIFGLGSNGGKVITIANNIINKENDNQHALWVRSSSETDFRLNLYFNTFYMGGGSADFSAALRIGGRDTGQADDPFSLLDIRNNIFMNAGSGKALSIYDAATALNSDYNAFFTPGQPPIQLGQQEFTLPSWQQAHQQDLHSLLEDPRFVSADSLVPTNPALDGAGSSIEGFTTDVYGQPRIFPRDMGAVEYDAGSGAPLAGSYTIGGPDGDFPGFSLAAQALESRGISDSVIFRIRLGLYEEQVRLGEISGSSCERRIVFEGESKDSTAVALKAMGDALVIEGADGISFRYLTIEGARITGGSNCITFENNRLQEIHASSGPGTMASNWHIYRNNYFSHGISKEKSGTFDPANPDFDEGLEISDNIISRGVKLSAQSGIIINDNRIKLVAAGGGSGALELTNCWYGKEIRRNIISVDSYYGDVYGIKTENGIPERVSENRIGLGTEESIPHWAPGEVGLGGGTGLLVSTGKTSSGQVLIANNSIGIDGWDRGGRISTMRGIHVKETYSNDDIIKIYHNSASTSGYMDLRESSALYTEVTANNSLYLLNNTFTDYADGYKIDVVYPSAVAVSDYNYFSTLGSSIFKWGNQEANNLAAWQALSGMDAHSITDWPLEGAGIRVEEVPYDINGKPRNNPPSIGPVEYGEPATPQPMAGIYTIGGTDGNFASFTQAVQALESRGISEAVTFKIRPGTYEEQLTIGSFPGSSQHHPVVFEGIVGDSMQVVLQYSGDYVLQLNGANGLTFRYLTISKTGPLNDDILSARVVDIRNGASYITFEHNKLKGKKNDYIIYSIAENAKPYNEYHTYRNNYFLEGGLGIYKNITNIGEGDPGERNTIIEDNLMEKQAHSSLDLNNQTDIRISNNIILLPTGYGASGIDLRGIRNTATIIGNKIEIEADYPHGIIAFQGASEISKNQILLKGNGIGISVYSYNVEATARITNNMVAIQTVEDESSIMYEGAMGVFLAHGGDTTQVNFNTISISGKGDNSTALFFDESYDLRTKIVNNNILANYADGYAMYTENNASLTSSDYNNYYTSGSRFIHKKLVDFPDLASWQIFNSADAHSKVADPQFKSASSLIPTNPALDGAGIYLAEVPIDYFGQIRNTPPDIGAVEFEPKSDKPEPTLGFVVGGAVFHSPLGAFTLNPFAEGRTILSFHADQKRGEERPKGVASLTIPQADFRFQSNNAYEWMAVEGHKAIMEGTGILNREAGYRFVISVVDWGTGSRDPKDTYRMIIWNPEGEVVYDNQRGLRTYATATMPIERGNILVRQEPGANARMSIAPSSGAIMHEFKAFPTKLDQEGLWLEIPDHELLGTEKYRFSILDRQGRVMTEGLLSSTGKQRLKLNTEQWAPGIYLLIIRGNGRQYQEKMVK